MVRGEMLIGSAAAMGKGQPFRAFDPTAGAALAPDFGSATAGDVARACALADAAFDVYRSTSQERRAQLLESIAENIAAGGEAIVARAMAETGLPRPRLEGELGRTTGQLKMFAQVVRDGAYLDVRIDEALPQRQPPRPDLRLTHIPLGPVAVFGASNFPLAFSAAGGDTASALAAGCPVIVKAHPAHPGTSELVGRAIQKAIAALDLPEGVFSLLFDAGIEIGGALAAAPSIQAVGFTGSRRGGLALVSIAQRRPQPIPVFAEMSSINPTILLPAALEARGGEIAKAFAAAVTLGAGQFCTNPGLLLALEGPALDSFLQGAAQALSQVDPATMLTAGIHAAYTHGVSALGTSAAVKTVCTGKDASGLRARAALFTTDAESFLGNSALSEEVFGPASLLVRCKDVVSLSRAITSLEGQLTIGVHADAADQAMAGALMPLLERRAGRIIFNGFGTGVEVCDAMVHGGPFPATSDPRSTSVGSLAIKRFLRPVCYQNVPAGLLPPAVQGGNPDHLPRRVNGRIYLD